MDKKTIYALTAKIFNTLKNIGIKPKLGVTTDVKRLPGTRNSLNTDLSTLGKTDPESLKRLITNDANFLPQATEDEIIQFNNNLEYLKSTYPKVFEKQQVVTEAKTGIKTLVDDAGEKIKKPAKEDYDEYADILNDSENTIIQGDETFEQLDALVKKQKDYEASMFRQYKMGKLDPEVGDKSQSRIRFLKNKAEEAEMSGDKKLITVDELEELEELQRTFETPATPELKQKMDEVINNLTGRLPAVERIKKLGFTPEQLGPDKIAVIEKYGNMLDEKLLKNILIDDNPQRIAEVLGSIDEAMKMQEKGISQEEIINIIKNTTRTKQAKGGLTKGLSYKSMFSDLDRTVKKGIGTMFRKRGR